MSAIARIEVRVDPEIKDRIERAAAFDGVSVSSFVVAAAQLRADEVVLQHTLVPADFFDALIDDLDEPGVANEAMVRAVRRSRARAAQH